MRLSTQLPRMNPPMKERVMALLADGCPHARWSGACQSETATLRRRMIRAAVTVSLQCDGCGASLGGALARAEHYYWQDYSLWDEDLVRRHREHRDQISAAYQQRLSRAREDAELASERRRIEYAEWCRTSPEWRLAKERTFWRSRGFCEACLAEKAATVHHLTYDLGKLPPFWELRAVCRDCHDRLHDPDDEWCLPGMGR